MLRRAAGCFLGRFGAAAKAVAAPKCRVVTRGLPAGADAPSLLRMPWFLPLLGALLLVAGQAAAGGVAPEAAAPEPRPSPFIAPATIDDTLEVSGEAVDAHAGPSRLMVPVWINERGPFRFLVDSGADRSVVGARMASQLRLPAGPSVRLFDVAGRRDAATVQLESLRVGGSRVANLVAPVLSERHMGAEGIIGIDALADQRLMLDFEKREVTVQPASARAAGHGADEIVVVARRRRGQLIITQASAGETRIHAVIDTGAELTLGNMALKARVLGGRRPLVPQPVELVGVSGEAITADLVVVPRMRVGRLTLENVPVAFAEIPPFRLFGLSEAPAVLLGTDVLELFRRVSLDFAAKRVRFQLR
jgi:predicted aspartyl protease